MTLYQDVVVKFADNTAAVYYKGEYIGKMQIQHINRSFRLFFVDGRRYDRAHVAARELVRRVRNV